MYKARKDECQLYMLVSQNRTWLCRSRVNEHDANNILSFISLTYLYFLKSFCQHQHFFICESLICTTIDRISCLERLLWEGWLLEEQPLFILKRLRKEYLKKSFLASPLSEVFLFWTTLKSRTFGDFWL